MLKQVKSHFVNRNLTSCLTLIGTYMCIAGIAGTKYYGPHPFTLAIGMIGAPSAWRAPKHVKTALSVADT